LNTSRKDEFKSRLYRYTIRLIRFIATIPDNLVSIEIKRQLVRSGTSIGANYFEALGASSKRDFQNFFNHSLKSSNESKFWIGLLLDANLIANNQRSECIGILDETKQLSNIFASSILTMKNKRL
jgi:four helix bundle protein